MPWYYGTRVVALYTTKHDKNSWVCLSGGGVSGWRMLKDSNDDAVINMMTMCAHAKTNNSYIDIEVDGDDEIITIYAW